MWQLPNTPSGVHVGSRDAMVDRWWNVVAIKSACEERVPLAAPYRSLRASPHRAQIAADVRGVRTATKTTTGTSHPPATPTQRALRPRHTARSRLMFCWGATRAICRRRRSPYGASGRGCHQVEWVRLELCCKYLRCAEKWKKKIRKLSWRFSGRNLKVSLPL